MTPRRHLIALLLLFVTAPMATLMAAPPPPVLGALANATYPGIEDHPVTLHDGIWEGEPYVEGGASRPRVVLVPGFRVVGDLDGDGASEAVVMLAATGGGSGNFKHLAVASRAENGDATVRAVAPLGDRVQVRYARIESGELLIDTVEAGDGDAACCPGTKRLRRWRWSADTLDEGPVTESGRLGPEDLGGGITWRLTHLDRDVAIGTYNPPTLVYDQGKVAGFAGCNRYFGSVAEGEFPGGLETGPRGTTRRACDPDAMALESDYLRHLDTVFGFAFQGGRLAMSYRDGERVGTMLFVAD